MTEAKEGILVFDTEELQKAVLKLEELHKGNIPYNYTMIFLKENIFKTFNDDTSIWIYDPSKGIYIRGEKTIMELCAPNPITARINIMRNVEAIIRGKTFCDRFKQPEGFINLKNGVLDLESMQLKPHDPKYLFLNRMEIDYLPDADCPEFKRLIEGAIPNKNNQMLLQEWFGYHFVPGQLMKKFLIIVGKKNTSKSTVLNILRMLIGEENVCSSQLKDFDDSQTHAVVELYGKLANITNELSEETLKHIDMLKKLTSPNDTVTARKHHCEPMTFSNQAKLSFACNRLPPLTMRVWEDDAFWDRIFLLQFDVEVQDKYRGLDEKIFRQEASGILNWALEGYLRLKERGDFIPQEVDIQEIWEDSNKGINPLKLFITEVFVFDGVGIISNEEAYKYYEEWCKKNPWHKKLSKYKFGHYMKEFGIEQTVTSIRSEDFGGEKKYTNQRVWQGITFKLDISKATARVQKQFGGANEDMKDFNVLD